MTIGQRIKRLRERNGLTQQQFAELLGVSDGAVSTWENDTCVPRMGVFQRIEDHFGIPKSYIIDGVRDGEQMLQYPDLEPITHTYRLPLLGPVAAGTPIQVSPEDAEYMELPYHPGKADAALRIEGDSMQPKYLDGDVVFIRFQPDVEEGQIAAVCIDDKATLKRVYHIPNGVQLVSENAAYPPMIFTMEDANNIRVIGLAVGYMRWEQ